MDKNTITGIVLIVLVLIGFSYFSQPSEEELKQQQEVAAKQAEEQKQQQAQADAKQTAAPAQTERVDSTSLFAVAAKAEPAAPVVLQNDKIKVTISPRGGLVSRVELLEFRNYADYHNGNTKATLLLYNDSTSSTELVYNIAGKQLYSSDYTFTAKPAADGLGAELVLADSTGQRRLVYSYRLGKGSYLVDFSIKAENLKTDLKADGGVKLTWSDSVKQHEKGYYFENMYSTLTYKDVVEGTEKLREQGDDSEQAENDVDWIAFKNQYFSSVLLAEQPLKGAVFESKQLEEGTGLLKHYKAEANVSLDPTGGKVTKLQYYFGPNRYLYLGSLEGELVGDKDQDLQELVYLGWPLFKWINRFFTVYVFDWFTRLGLPMAVVLLLITLLLRVIVYYPNRKSYLSSAKMRVLKPKIDEIAKKYPNSEDAMKRQQETMQLYSQYGVSPMGGCLPMLIQMPIWIAMFNFVPNAFELRQQSFLWADDLSTYDSVINWNGSVWALGDHISIFCLLFCLTNVVYSLIMMRQQQQSMSSEQASQMKIMQWMMLLMPIFFFFMFNKYSSGLNYYYFISLLFGALTMWYLRRSTNDEKLLAQLEANFEANKHDPNKRPSSLASRLAKLQEQQDELRKKQDALSRKRKK